jgi:hypothetical protein
MFRRVLTAAAGIAILISALLVNLALLDIITVQDLRTTLGKIVSVIVVSTIAVVLVIAVMKIGERR